MGCHPPPTSLYIQGWIEDDFPQTFPMSRPNPVRLVVENSARYGLNYTDADAEWGTLMPHELAVVYLGPSHRPFVASQYHSLHCLQMMRSAIIKNPPPGTSQREHMQHCINYVRQMILCTADTTLEPVLDGAPSENAGVGVAHTCKDWSALAGATEENYQRWLALQLEE